MNDSFTFLKVLKVENVYQHEVAKCIHSVRYNYSPDAFKNFLLLSTHSYATRLRQNSHFSLTKPSTEFGKKSLRFSGVKIWFKLSQEVKEISDPKKFNNAVKAFLLL